MDTGENRSSMDQLFLLTGDRKTVDLKYQIETTLSDIRRLKDDVSKTQVQLSGIQDLLRKNYEVVANLRSNGCRIVSLGEYANLRAEILRGESAKRATLYRLGIEQCLVHRANYMLNQYEIQLQVHLDTHGQVLDFKKHE